MTTLYDVLRALVRGYPNTEANQRYMLLSIDAAEQGYETTEEYVEHLDEAARQVAAQPVEETDEARATRLEAEVRAVKATPPVHRVAPRQAPRR